MNKAITMIGIIAVVIAMYFIFFKGKDSDVVVIDTHTQNYRVNDGRSNFNTKLDMVLNDYSKMRNAFVNWDTAKANEAAEDFKKSLSRVPFNEVVPYNIDSAKNAAESVEAEAEGLIAEHTVEDKRRSFYTLSESLFSLLKISHYDGRVIYHQKCPMAFNGTEEGWWLSETTEITNPYLGNKHPKYHSAMLTCGSTEDSIDFRK